MRKGSDLLPTMPLLHVLQVLIVFILCQVLAVHFQVPLQMVLLEESVRVQQKSLHLMLMLNGTTVREHRDAGCHPDSQSSSLFCSGMTNTEMSS